MKHKGIMIVVVLTAVLTAALFAQTASDFEVALTEDGNGVVINKYTGKITNTITIPATIEGLPVREIGGEAFSEAGIGNSYRDNVSAAGFPFTVVLPPGLFKIGYRAFASSALTSIVIPDSVTYIDSEAFAWCFYYEKTGFRVPQIYSLTSVTLPKGLTTVGEGAFKGNESLKTVVIPNGVPVIGERMFERCRALTTITIPDSVTSIGGSAFADTGLSSITFAKGVASIGPEAFSGCKELQTIVIPEWVTEIGERAFSGCSALTTVTISESVESIQLGGTNYSSGRTLLEGVFNGCGKLNLATQARLKKITMTTAYEVKEREEKERRAQEIREEEERRAQVKREEEERRAQAERERDVKIQGALETAKTLNTRLTPIYMVASRRDKPTTQQFNEFIAIYQDYIAAKNNYGSLDYVPYNLKVDLDFSYETLGNHIRAIIRVLDNNQRKQFDAKFGN